MTIDETVKEYENLFPTYNDFSQELERLLERLLREQRIEFIKLEHRAKDPEHFREKIGREGKSYTDPLRQVTDLCGARIIVRRVSDVPRVVEVIERQLVLDPDNSVDKATNLDANEFDYLSVHLVVKLSQGQIDHGGYRRFRDLRAEIQIRTTLQHAWAEISHLIGYKKEPTLPYELRRRLFRLIALFELGDQEIDLLVEHVQEKTTYYKAKLNHGDRDIEINEDSLKAFIETTEEAREWVNRGGRISGQQISTWNNLSTTVKLAEYCGLKSLEEIKRILVNARLWGERFLGEVFNDLARRYHYKTEMMEISQNGLVQALIIGSMAERLPAKTLEREIGLPRTGIVDIALRCRGITPVTRSRASQTGRSIVKRRRR
jgi:ppGpp synthetase/RelA/SpoT-type nucleotidyltranferase